MAPITAALFLVVESNNNKGGGGGYYLGGCRTRLEDELIDCLRSWRSKGGIYKDIKIYAFCPTNNPPSDDAINKMKAYDVEYIHEYHSETDKFPAGWWNVPFVGMLLEERIKEDLLIHIDLDMVLLKELTSDFIIPKEGYVGKCAVYSEEFPDDEEIDGIKKHFVTCFLSSWTNQPLYKMWYERMMKIWSTWDRENNTWWAECNIEEYAFDNLFFKDEVKIEEVNKCQIGPGYDTVESLTDEEFNNVYFLHGHLTDPERPPIILEYCKRKTRKT